MGDVLDDAAPPPEEPPPPRQRDQNPERQPRPRTKRTRSSIDPNVTLAFRPPPTPCEREREDASLRFPRGRDPSGGRFACFRPRRGFGGLRRGPAADRELQTAQGFLTGNVPEFQEGLVNQAIGPYVSGYGSYLKSTYGGRKLLIGEGLASLGQGMQQLGQAQAGLAFVGKDRPTFDKGVETAWKGAGLKIYGDTLSKWTG